MKLKTNDGMILMSQSDAELLESINCMLPDLQKSLSIVSGRIDEKIGQLHKERDTCGKLRRLLADIQGKIKILNTEGE